MILYKFISPDKTLCNYKKLMSYSGRLVTDFVSLIGFRSSILNMGILGLIGMLYVYLVGGALNGPVLGGIFTFVGFGAFGKHPRNTIPIIAGVDRKSVV